jgi:hypothetical protein
MIWRAHSDWENRRYVGGIVSEREEEVDWQVGFQFGYGSHPNFAIQGTSEKQITSSIDDDKRNGQYCYNIARMIRR